MTINGPTKKSSRVAVSATSFHDGTRSSPLDSEGMSLSELDRRFERCAVRGAVPRDGGVKPIGTVATVPSLTTNLTTVLFFFRRRRFARRQSGEWIEILLDTGVARAHPNARLVESFERLNPRARATMSMLAGSCVAAAPRARTRPTRRLRGARAPASRPRRSARGLGFGVRDAGRARGRGGRPGSALVRASPRYDLARRLGVPSARGERRRGDGSVLRGAVR